VCAVCALCDVCCVCCVCCVSFLSCVWCTVIMCLQSAALLADRDITTASHIILRGLCCNAGGSHFAAAAQVGSRTQDVIEGVIPEDKYYICDGLIDGGKFQLVTPERWLRMMKLWLVHTCGTVLLLCWLMGRVPDVIAIPNDEAKAERLKTILLNCVGNLRCKWTELVCENKLPGADAAIRIQSCAYDTEVWPCPQARLPTIVGQAVWTVLLMLLLPQESMSFLEYYPDLPTLAGNDVGVIVSTVYTVEDHPSTPL
jgi:hypothetical protein